MFKNYRSLTGTNKCETVPRIVDPTKTCPFRLLKRKPLCLVATSARFTDKTCYLGTPLFDHVNHLVGSEHDLNEAPYCHFLPVLAANPLRGVEIITCLKLSRLQISLKQVIKKVLPAFFSPVWKNATVIPILKKARPPYDLKSYRPIALLWVKFMSGHSSLTWMAYSMQ